MMNNKDSHLPRFILATSFAVASVMGACAGTDEPIEVDPWQTHSTLRIGRSHATSGVLGQKMFIAGGFTDGVASQKIDRFDSATKTWAEIQPFAVARAEHGSAMLDGRLYLIGGRGSDGPLDSVEVYDPATNEWTTRAPLLAPRFGHAVVTYKDGIVVMGGEVDGFSSRSVLRYDAAADAWTPMPDLLSAGGLGVQAAVVDGRIIVVGGYIDSPDQCEAIAPLECGALSAVEAFDEAQGAWQPMPKMNERRFDHTLAVVGDTLYAIGGYDVQVKSSVELFDGVTWTSSDPLTAPRAGATSIVVEDRIHVLGGFGLGLPNLSSVIMRAP